MCYDSPVRNLLKYGGTCREVNSAWYYNTAEQRESQISAERAVVNRVVESVIALKKQVRNDSHRLIVDLATAGLRWHRQKFRCD